MDWEREPAKVIGPLGKMHSQSWSSPVCHCPQEDIVSPSAECVERGTEPVQATGHSPTLRAEKGPSLQFSPSFSPSTAPTLWSLP